MRLLNSEKVTGEHAPIVAETVGWIECQAEALSNRQRKSSEASKFRFLVRTKRDFTSRVSLLTSIVAGAGEATCPIRSCALTGEREREREKVIGNESMADGIVDRAP